MKKGLFLLCILSVFAWSAHGGAEAATVRMKTFQYVDRQGMGREAFRMLIMDEYHDPMSDRPVELPLSYNRAWTNGLGDYVLSDDYSFDPNIGSTQNWQQMRRRQ